LAAAEPAGVMADIDPGDPRPPSRGRQGLELNPDPSYAEIRRAPTTAHRHRPDTGGWKTTTGSCSRPTAAARRCALPPPRRGDRGPQTEPRV